MSPYEHYREAERLVRESNEQIEDFWEGYDGQPLDAITRWQVDTNLAAAQVHATLATVDAKYVVLAARNAVQ